MNVEQAVAAGVLGQCHRNHMAVWLSSVSPDRMTHLPDRVHPLIESLLAVPIVTDDGWFWGVLPLFNISHNTDGSGALEVDVNGTPASGFKAST